MEGENRKTENKITKSIADHIRTPPKRVRRDCENTIPTSKLLIHTPGISKTSGAREKSVEHTPVGFEQSCASCLSEDAWRN
jgi:hypothetical protein